jgi:hypothetical protein
MFEFCFLLVIDVPGLRIGPDQCRKLDEHLERYRQAHGQFPESLRAVAPGFISQLPHDIINGEPLTYRRTPDGQYLLYSAGRNQSDEGGVLGFTQSVTGIDQRAGDWVWRLPP